MKVFHSQSVEFFLLLLKILCLMIILVEWKNVDAATAKCKDLNFQQKNAAFISHWEDWFSSINLPCMMRKKSWEKNDKKYIQDEKSFYCWCQFDVSKSNVYFGDATRKTLLFISLSHTQNDFSCLAEKWIDR